MRAKQGSSRKSQARPDVAVVGGGPAGLVTALALAAADVPVQLYAPPFNKADARTSALMRGSIAFLRQLGAWRALKPAAAPLARLRIVDATGRLIRAPEVLFDCDEVDGEPFAYNLPNRALNRVLSGLAAKAPQLRLRPLPVRAMKAGDGAVTVTDEDGKTARFRLVAAADGRNSLGRQAAGITTRQTAYDQVALAFNIEHELAHDETSTEFHTSSGPLTLVPLPGRASSVVWGLRREEADELRRLSEAELIGKLHERTFAVLGRITKIGPVSAFPLSITTVSRMAAKRIALVGEAGHVVPPIGAQGLNLGFRDAATLAQLVADAVRAGADPGSETVQGEYHRLRRADIASRAGAIDLLNRSVLSPLLPAQLARGAGLYLLGRISPLRRLTMQAGMHPPGKLPRLMRGEPV